MPTGRARWIRDDVLPGEELCVQLERPAALRGHIRLADGTGLSARLRVWNAQRCKYVEAGRTGAGGAFLFERLPSGPVTVAVIRPPRVGVPEIVLPLATSPRV